MQKAMKRAWQGLAAVAVVLALGFGVQTALAGQSASPCNPYPDAAPGYPNGPWCEHALCDECCQLNFEENGVCQPDPTETNPGMNHCLCF
ncbi:MAG: hypothetical protein WD934_03225 [Gemmatimonadales bacterium]